MVQMEDLALLVKRLEVVTEKLEAAGDQQRFGASSSGDIRTADKLGLTVTAFDDICSGTFKAFLELCSKVGHEVQELAPLVEQAFSAQREFLRIASLSREPKPADLQNLLKPIADIIQQIQEFRERGRRCDHFNHLSALSESIPALGWVTVSPAPAPFVLEMNHAGEFYTNRVLKDWKEKSAVHVEWVKAWIKVLTELQAYVKQFHTTGLTWNKTDKAEDALTISKSKPVVGGGTATAPPPPPPGPPAPPPPPPPAPVADTESKGGREALLESLNQGADLATGLRKVKDEEKTHKNPALRSDGLVKTSEKTASEKVAAVGSQHQARTELDGKRWNVEHHKGNKKIVIVETEPNQSVYVYKCEGSTIQVGGKVNNIILDGCKKTGLVFQSVVSGVELINCQSMQIQALGAVPTISVDKTDGCQMFLSKESLGVDIITSKSSEMNVMIPTDEEFVEQPLPEQFRTTVEGLKLKTQPTDWNIDIV